MKAQWDKILKEKMNISISNLELHSKSTNQLYFFESENENFVLKTPNMSLSGLSPFWKQLRRIFGSDFVTQTKNIHSLAEYLNQNPLIKIPKVIASETADIVLQVFERMAGSFYEPDEFPAEISYQLGRYIGWVHSHKFDGYGIFSDQPQLENCAGFFAKMLRSTGDIINEHWQNNNEVLGYYKNINKIVPKDIGSCSLIMPDISANQFVYSSDYKRINALVDLDAYVIGPIHLELTVLELCLTDPQSFKRGYEEYCSLPSFKPFRSFYRFYVYLNDPWNPPNLSDFLNANILFS